MTACLIINIRVAGSHQTTTRFVEESITKTRDTDQNRILSDWFEKSGNTGVARELRRSKDLLTTPVSQPVQNTGILGSQINTLKYWENIIEEKPDYRDAFLSAAKSALYENNPTAALQYAKKALEIDPNNKIALVLKTVLEKNTFK